MKHTMKRALALVLALLLALPTFAFAEDFQQPEVVLAGDGNDAQGDGQVAESPHEEYELLLGYEDEGIPLEAPADGSETGAPNDGAAAVDPDAEVTYCFIVDNVEYASQTAREGDVIRRPEDPAAPEGMAFGGWVLADGAPLFCDADGDGEIDEVVAHPDGFTTLVNVDAVFVQAEDGEEEKSEGETTSSVSADAEPASPDDVKADSDGVEEKDDSAEINNDADGEEEATSSVTADAVPASQGSADPFSLESVHRTDSQALEPPQGEGFEDSSAAGETSESQEPSPATEGGDSALKDLLRFGEGAPTGAEEVVSPDNAQADSDGEEGTDISAEKNSDADGEEEATSSVTADAVPASQGSADPFSLESVHRTDSQALEPPQGEAIEEPADAEGDSEPQEPSPVTEGEGSGDSSAAEASSVRVTAIFMLEPEDAALTVYAVSRAAAPDAEPVEAAVSDLPVDDAAQPDEASEDLPSYTPIPAQADGSYALVPGEYAYTASAEGYISFENVPFTVEESDETLYFSIVLEPADQEEAAPVGFEQSRTVGGVIVTVKAEPGAFPEGATLSVARVPVTKRLEAESAVDEAREDDQNVVVSYTFDIKVLDADGNELQPADGFGAEVSFALEQAADENLEASVYHVTPDENGNLTADKLDDVDVDAAEQTVTAQTDGFSIYTVEFTYDALQYVLHGGDSVPLSAVLDAVGLVGAIEGASVSDEALFSVSDETGAWTLETHRPFITEEWLRVILNGVEYEITVTDDGAVEVAYCALGTIQKVVAASVAADTATLKDSSAEWYVVNESVTLDNRLEVEGRVNLILADGATLDAPKGIRVPRGSGLTIYGQSRNATGKLNATAGKKYQAGIGGDRLESGGDFTLYGCEVSAVGGLNAAGLGGGDSGSGGVVTIYGGKLTARGNDNGAGIGGGDGGSQGGAVTIWDGTVTATGGLYGAGIGGGCNFSDWFSDGDIGGNGGYVYIYGGKVVARGGLYGAGIGGGEFGNGGVLSINGTCEITAIAGKDSDDDGDIQAIGRGLLSDCSAEEREGAQTEGSVVFPSSVLVKAGNDAASAKQLLSDKYQEGCRMPYVHITASNSLSNAINATINQLHADGVTDTIEAQDMQGKSVNSAGAGEQFQVVVTLVNSTLESLTATYEVDGAAQPLRWDREDKSADGKVVTYVFTMPGGVNGTVDISAVVKATQYRITLPKPIEGTVEAIVNSRAYTDTAYAIDGDEVRLRTTVKDGYRDYYVQKIEVIGDNTKEVYAKLENDTITNMTKGASNDEWIFKMHAEPVTVNMTLREGCYYINLNGDRIVRRNFTVISSQDNLTLSGGAGGWYAVRGNVTVKNRISATSDINLILCDGASLTANGGISVLAESNASLTIWAQDAGTGKLTANASKGAGIGSNSKKHSGAITINGGVVSAQGGKYSAGIGGGENAHNQGAITINVPKGKLYTYTTVSATGGKYGPGIGGGQNTNNQLTVINNGKVTAWGGEYGAGIGGGEGGGNEVIEIHGGYVWAKGGNKAAGLGGGQVWRGGGMGGTVKITGGTVKAYGNNYAAGIGPGEDGVGLTYIQTGGEVYAEAGKESAAIGGAKGKQGGNVTVTGGILQASGDCGSAIGGGKGCDDNGSLTIGAQMMVRAGNSGHNSYERTFTAGERAAACHYRRYARIEPCTHSGRVYTYVDVDRHHDSGCSYCGIGQKTEAHTWGGANKNTCTKCNACVSALIILGGHAFDPMKVTANGASVSLMFDTNDSGRIREGQAVEIVAGTKQAYAFTGEPIAVQGPVADLSEWIDENGKKHCAFTMPAGDVTLDLKTVSLRHQVHACFNNQLGKLKFIGDGSTHNTDDGIYYRSASLGEVAIVATPTRGYMVHDVRMYVRNADGSDGASVDFTNPSDNRYAFQLGNFDMNVYVDFERPYIAKVYHVLQTFDAQTGAAVWPADAPSPLSGQAKGTYTFQASPSGEAVTGPLDPSAYELVGYSPDFRTEGFNEIPGNGSIIVEQDNSEIYAYYQPKRFTLKVFDETYTGDASAVPLNTLSVPAGTPLAQYLETMGIMPDGSGAGEYRWARRDEARNTYIVLPEGATMPAADLCVYPTNAQVDVIVMLDTGAYDQLAAENADLIGPYWDYANASYWAEDFSWQKAGNSGDERVSPVHLGGDAPRSFRLVEGEPMPDKVVKALNGATRTGFRLTGWQVVRADGSTQPWDEDMGTSAEAFYRDTTALYQDGPDAGEQYHVVYLKATWALRDALVVYDPGIGVWKDGQSHTQIARANEYFELPSVLKQDIEYPSGGSSLTNQWQDRDGLTHRDGTRLFYSGKLEYVTEAADTADPNAVNVIRMTKKFHPFPATTNKLEFRKPGKTSSVNFAEIPIAEGEGTGEFVVTFEDGVTRVFDGAGNELKQFKYEPKGYTLLGWSTEMSAPPRRTVYGSVSRDSQNSWGGVILFAGLTENEYELSFDLNGGRWPEGTYVRTRYKYGEKIDQQALVPVREHYDFRSWRILPVTMPAEDLNVKALWRAHNYTMTFTSEGVELLKASGPIGTPVARPADPTREGYVFAGWSPECPEGETLYMPGMDVIYTAVWLEALPKPAAPVARAVDRETLAVEDPAEDQLYSIDGGATWHRRGADGKLTFVHLTPGETYSVVTYVEGEEDVSLDSPVSDPTPVTLPQAVAVRLDLNAYDLAAELSPSLEGQYWGADWPAHADEYGAFFPDGHQDTPRSFMIDAGQPLDAETAASLAGAWRKGYLLVDWTTQSGAPWSATSKAVEAVFDTNDDGSLKIATAISDDGDEYTYYFITLKAGWKPRDARVAYDLNGGSWPAGQALQDLGIALNETHTIENVVPVYSSSNQLWEFAGWTRKDAAGNEYTHAVGDKLTYKGVSDLPAEDVGMDAPVNGACAPNVIRLTAQYRLKPSAETTLSFVNVPNTVAAWAPFTVTIDEGTATAEVAIAESASGYTVSDGYNTKAYDAPEGCAFAGWFEDAECKKPVASPIVVDRSGRTVYAKWDVLKYTISFDTDGGSDVAPITQDYGTTVTAPADPAREHYDFVGWEPDVPETMPAQDMNLKAVWKPSEYKIIFKLDDETVYKTITGAYDVPVTLPDNPSRADSRFNGWMLEGGENKAVALPATMPDTNPTYVARWLSDTDVPVAPTVTGSTRETLTVAAEPGQRYVVVSDGAAAPDVNSADWKPESGGATIAFDGLTPGATYNVYASKLNPATDTEWIRSEPTVVKLPRAVVVRLDLGAYDTEANAQGANIWGDYWSANERPVYANACPATLSDAQLRSFMMDEGQDMLELADGSAENLAGVARSGYLPNGWTTRSGAKWSAESDAVEAVFDLADDGSLKTAEIARPSASAYTCYFITLKANWKLRPADVVYTLNGVGKWPDGSAADRAAGPVAAGAFVAMIGDVPVNDGQTFACWRNEANGATYAVGDSLINDDPVAVAAWGTGDANNAITLTAVYVDKEAATGKLSFDSRGGSEVQPINVVIPKGRDSAKVTVSVSGGQTIISGGATCTFANPTRAGYAFAGWSDAPGGQAVEAVSFTREAPDATLYAVWTVNTHRITVKNLGEQGSETAKISDVAYDTLLSNEFIASQLSDTQKSRQHWRFKGEFADLPAAMPDADVTVTAAWEPVVYTVTLKYSDYVTADAVISGEFGATIDRPANPTREGYMFRGWTLDGALAALPDTMPDTNPTYEAAWLIRRAPEVTAVTRSTLTVKAEPGQEYSIDGGATWIAPTGDSHTFENLIPGDTYEVITRVAAVQGISDASEPSDATRVTLPQAVAVRLDLGAYDYEANATGDEQAEKGAYWGTDWPDYPQDEKTPARMDVGQHRSFIKDEGETIEVGLMNTADRYGYELVGWYTPSGAKWEDNSPAIREYYDSQTPVGTGANAYYTITLKARWKVRDAEITYDPGDLGWADGAAAPQAQTIQAGGTVNIASAMPKAPAGKVFAYWKDADGKVMYHPDGQYGMSKTFTYGDLSGVSTFGIGKEQGNQGDVPVSNKIVLTAVFADVPASDALLVFNSQGGSAVLPVKVTIPQGQTSTTATVSVSGDQTIVSGGVSATFDNPVRKGYTFVGWSETENGAAASPISVEFARSNDQDVVTRTLHAVWQLNTYTVTFTNLESRDVVISVAYGAPLSPSIQGWPANPQKVHFRFKEWSPALPEAMPAENLTVAAIWQPLKYTVTFKVDGVKYHVIEDVYGAQIAAPADPTKEGFVFRGWKLDSTLDDTLAALPDTMPDTNPTYVAAWLAKPDQPSAPTVTATTRESLTVSAAQAQKYLVVFGSTTGADIHSGDWKQPAQGAGEIAFNDLTPGATYSVFTYIPATGSGDMDSDVSKPTIVTLPEAVVVRLDLGACDADKSQGTPDPYPLGKDYTDATTQAYLDATQWRSTLTDMGGKIDMSRMSAATRDGYLLDNWTAQGTAWGTARAIAAEYCEPGGKVSVDGVPYPCYVLTLKANWKLRPANVIYTLNGVGKWPDGRTADRAAGPVAAGASVAMIGDVPVNDGQTFAYWSNAVNGDMYAVGDSLINDDPEAVAEWGTGEDTTAAEYKNTIRLTAVYIDKDAVTGKLSFDSRGGSEAQPMYVVIPKGKDSAKTTVSVSGGQTIISGGASDTFPNPIREGYTFMGWSDAPGGQAAEQTLTFTREALDATLYAVWTVNKHKITVTNLGGQGNETVEIPGVAYDTFLSNEYITSQLSDEQKTRKHMRFKGEFANLPAAMPDADVEVSAAWEPVVYTITLKYNDSATSDTTISGVFGALVNRPADPTREGYVFRGWKLNGQGELISRDKLPDTMPDTNPTYEAAWLRKPAQSDAPEVTEVTRSTLTVKAEPGQEYSIDGGATWKAPTGDSHTFENLIPGDTYEVITRVAAIQGISDASEPSDATRVTLPQAVAVRLDLGAYDYEANATGDEQAEKGAYWGADWPYYPKDADTPAHMDVDQHRSFIKDEGDTILVGRMVSANRDGYELVGWYTPSGAKWVDNSPAIREYYDSQTPVGTGANAYYTITLKARWKVRDAEMTYDPGDLGWADGAAAPAAQTLRAGDTVDIASAMPKAPAGKVFACWRDASGNVMYHPDGQYGMSKTFTYGDLSGVTTIGGKQWDTLVNNKIVLTAVFADVPASDALLVFNSQGGGAVLPVEIAIPEGQESVTAAVSCSGGQTAVAIDATSQSFANPVRKGYTFVGWSESENGAAASPISVTFTRDNNQRTLYAVWRLNTYTVTFTNLESRDVVISVEYGAPLSESIQGWPADPLKNHFNFVEWSPALPEAMPAENLTVAAIWQPLKYTVSFEVDGVEYHVIEDVYGAQIAAPADPTKEGCVFKSWTLNGTITQPPAAMPDTNPTYVAAWRTKPARPDAPKVEAKTHETLTVAAVAGQVYSIDNGATWTAPSGDSLTFTGLTPGATYNVLTYKPSTGDDNVDSDVSKPTAETLPEAVMVRLDLGAYDANWSANPANQTYTDAATQAYMNAGQWRSILTDMGDKIDMSRIDAATRDGYLLDNWTAQGSAWDANTVIALNLCEPGGKASVDGVPYPCYVLMLKANWKLRPADVIYTLNGVGKWADDSTDDRAAGPVAGGASVAVIGDVPVNDGQIFAYWRNEANGEMYAVGDSLTNDDPEAIAAWGTGSGNNTIKLTAVYIDKDAVTGKLSFDSRGGSDVQPMYVVIPRGRDAAKATVSVSGGQTITSGGASDTFPNPIREGYTFMGWSDAPGGQAAEQTVSFTREAPDATLYAVWQLNSHSITVTNLGAQGSETVEITVPYGTPISNAFVLGQLDRDTHLTRAHHIFQGVTPTLSGTMPDADVRVTAVWEPVVYTVTLVYNDGVTANYRISGVCGATISDWPFDPTCEGYTFKGWKRLDTGEVLAAPLDAMPGEDRTYVAQWSVKPYTITFDTNGGSDVAPITQDYNTTVTPPDDPTKEHCDFVRWEPDVPERMPAANLTVSAVWRQHDYTMTFMDGGAVHHRIIDAYGAKVVPPLDPAREGEVFKGWSVDGTAVADLPDAMPDTNPTYYAVWKAPQDAPAKPAASATGATAIQVVDPVSTQEYRWRLADDEGASWSEWERVANGKVEFTGLEPATNYVVQARVIETKDAKASDPSALSDAIQTPKGDQDRPDPPALSAGVNSLSVVNPSDAMEYQYADLDAPDAWSAWQSPRDGKLTFDGLKAYTDYQVRARLKETASLNPSEPSDPEVTYTLMATMEEVEIIGEPVVGNTLQVRVDPGEVANELYYFWYRNDEYVKVQIFSADVLPEGYDLSDEPEPCYTLTAEDIGANIRLLVMQFDVDTPIGYAALSDVTGQTRKRTPPTPGIAGVVRGNTTLLVQVAASQDGANYSYEYSLDGATWQDAASFAGLEEDTGYTVYVRVKEAEEWYASEPATLDTNTTKTLLTGVRIEGTAALGKTLRAIADPNGAGDLSWQWTRNGQPIDGATGAAYTLTAADAGAAIGVTLTQAVNFGDDVVLSASVNMPKLPGGAAATPKPASRTATSLTIATQPGEEYSIDGGKTWQTGNTFTGLNPGTEYAIVARKAETAATHAGAASAPLSAATDKLPGGAAAAPKLANRTATSLTIETRPGEEYSIDGGKTWQTGNTFTGLNPNTVYEIVARMAETATAHAGAASGTLAAATMKQPEGFLIATMVSDSDTSLRLSWTGVDGVNGYDIFFRPCDNKKVLPLIATIESGDVTDYTVTGLDANKSYKAYVRAWIGEGGSKDYVLNESPIVHAFTGNGTKKIANPGSLTLKRSAMTLKLGKTASIKATVKTVKKGKLINHVAKLRYISSDPSVAAVSSKGKVKAVGAGSCVIYVLTTNGIYKTVTVAVDANPTKVSIRKPSKTMSVGATQDLGLKVQLTPSNAIRSLTWTSSNPDVATVDAAGKVKAIKKGETVITVTASGGKKAVVKIRVK